MTDRLSWIVLFFLFVLVVIIVWGIVVLHSYPGKVAERRKHPQKDAIDAMSVMGLLLFPLWMFALIWSYTRPVVMPVQLSESVKDSSPIEPDDAPASDDDARS